MSYITTFVMSFQNSWLIGRYSHEKFTPIDLTDLTSKSHHSAPSPPLSDVDSARFVENRCDLDDIRWDPASSRLDPARSRLETSRFGQISTKVVAPSILTEIDHCPTKLKPTPLVVFGSWWWVSCPITRSCRVDSELGTNLTQTNPWTTLVPKIYF